MAAKLTTNTSRRRCGVYSDSEPTTNVTTYLLTYLPRRAALSANKMSLLPFVNSPAARWVYHLHVAYHPSLKPVYPSMGRLN